MIDKIDWNSNQWKSLCDSNHKVVSEEETNRQMILTEVWDESSKWTETARQDSYTFLSHVQCCYLVSLL